MVANDGDFESVDGLHVHLLLNRGADERDAGLEAVPVEADQGANLVGDEVADLDPSAGELGVSELDATAVVTDPFEKFLDRRRRLRSFPSKGCRRPSDVSVRFPAPNIAESSKELLRIGGAECPGSDQGDQVRWRGQETGLGE
jgi:hypothetical protein